MTHEEIASLFAAGPKATLSPLPQEKPDFTPAETVWSGWWRLCRGDVWERVATDDDFKGCWDRLLDRAQGKLTGGEMVVLESAKDPNRRTRHEGSTASTA